MSELLLQADGLRKHFAVRNDRLFGRTRRLRAIDGVSFALEKGEVLGIVGESGCGKSTLGRLILRLVELDAGKLQFRGHDVGALRRRELRELRRHIQLVFQDPVGSLNPRMSVGRALVDVLRFHGIGSAAERIHKVHEILNVIGLGADYFDRLPHELSGGQSQRIGIARALILRPDLVVFDEPVSALDVSIQAQILQLLIELRREFRLTYIFISHDLGVVRQISNRIAVLYLGKLVEIGPTNAVSTDPLHPYTRALLRSVLEPNPRLNRVEQIASIEGDLPSPIDPPSGCRFHTRCPHAGPRCASHEPPLYAVDGARHVACFLYDPNDKTGRPTEIAQ